MAPVLIAAVSGRALAAAARRAGRDALVLDLFGDLDTVALAAASATVRGDLVRGFDADALLEAADRLAPAGHGTEVVYGTGFEARPALLAALGRGRRLLGNAPETLARIKNPAEFFGLLDRLGLPHPEIRLAPPTNGTGWLAKRIGGAGGGHIRAAQAREDERDDCYYQRRVEGSALSVLFLADGRGAARPLGFSEQWTAPCGDAQPYRFGGAVGPVAVSPKLARSLTVAVECLASETGLRGLNSLDVIAGPKGEGDDFTILEVNPRPGATLDVFDGPRVKLFGLHVAACEGRLPEGPAPHLAEAFPGMAVATAVVYAERDLTVPAGVSWPDWTADRPAAGTAIERGAPVCTVLARAETPQAARAKVKARADFLLSTLQDADQAKAEQRRHHGT